MPERATLLPRDGAPRRERAAVAAVLLVALVGCCAAAALVRGAAPRGAGTVLFQNPSTPADDADSWTIQGILDDGIDGDSGSDPFKLDVAAAEREARRKARLGLRQVGSQRTTMLLGGDDWLGAPLAVPEDVRENGEQRVPVCARPAGPDAAARARPRADPGAEAPVCRRGQCPGARPAWGSPLQCIRPRGAAHARAPASTASRRPGLTALPMLSSICADGRYV